MSAGSGTWDTSNYLNRKMPTTTGSATYTRYVYNSHHVGDDDNGWITIIVRWKIVSTVTGTSITDKVYQKADWKRGWWNKSADADNLTTNTDSKAVKDTSKTVGDATTLKHVFNWYVYAKDESDKSSDRTYTLAKDKAAPSSWTEIVAEKCLYTRTFSRPQSTSDTTNYEILATSARDSYSYDTRGSRAKGIYHIIQNVKHQNYTKFVYYKNKDATLTSGSVPSTVTKWNSSGTYTLAAANMRVSGWKQVGWSTSSTSSSLVKTQTYSASDHEKTISLYGVWQEVGFPAPPTPSFNNLTSVLTRDDTEDTYDDEGNYVETKYFIEYTNNVSHNISYIADSEDTVTKIISSNYNIFDLKNNVSIFKNEGETTVDVSPSTSSGTKTITYENRECPYSYIDKLSDDYYISADFQTYNNLSGGRYSTKVNNKVYGPANTNYIANKKGSTYNIELYTKYDDSIASFIWTATGIDGTEKQFYVNDNRKFSITFDDEDFTPVSFRCNINNYDEWQQTATVNILLDSESNSNYFTIPMVYILADEEDGIVHPAKDWNLYEWSLLEGSRDIYDYDQINELRPQKFCGFYKYDEIDAITGSMFYDEDGDIAIGNYIVIKGPITDYYGGSSSDGVYIEFYEINGSNSFWQWDAYYIFVIGSQQDEYQIFAENTGFLEESVLEEIKTRNKLMCDKVKFNVPSNSQIDTALADYWWDETNYDSTLNTTIQNLVDNVETKYVMEKDGRYLAVFKGDGNTYNQKTFDSDKFYIINQDDNAANVSVASFDSIDEVFYRGLARNIRFKYKE